MISTQNRGRAAGFSWCVAPLLTVGLVVSGITAQNQKQNNTGDPAGDPARAPAATGAAEAAAESAAESVAEPTSGTTGELLARIEAQVLQVRCFAAVNSPVYEGELARGTVVEVGAEVGEFRQVRLPLGVIGYVSKRFTTTPAEGLVRTTGTAVSFRYRPTPPRRAEQPVTRLPKGTTLKFLGEKGDWWKVRMMTESAFLPLKDVRILTVVDAAAKKSREALAGQHDAEWRTASRGYETAIAATAKRAAQRDRLTALRSDYAKELAKPLAVQQLAPVHRSVANLVAELPEDSPLLVAARRLAQSIKTQQVLAQAEHLIKTKPAMAKAPDLRIVETPRDPLSHLQHIGWLSYHPRASGAAAFRLTKGGQVVRYLKCSSMRYDLSLFHGVEIGVAGEQRQGKLLSYLDVNKIVVLGHSR